MSRSILHTPSQYPQVDAARVNIDLDMLQEAQASFESDADRRPDSFDSKRDAARHEASRLGQRLLMLDKYRHIPVIGRAKVDLERTSVRGSAVGDYGSDSPRTDISIMACEVDAGYVLQDGKDTLKPMASAWRATARTIGSEPLGIYFSLLRSQDNVERFRRLLGVTLDLVEYEPGAAPSSQTINASEYYQFYPYYKEQDRAAETLDADDPHYTEQYTVLRAMRVQLGGRIHIPFSERGLDS